MVIFDCPTYYTRRMLHAVLAPVLKMLSFHHEQEER